MDLSWNRLESNVRPGARKKLQKFVVENIDDPISIIYLRSLGRQGTVGRERVNTLMEQGIDYRNQKIKGLVK